MKVLVTGGAGYIGSHAVREFRDAGTRWRCSTTSRPATGPRCRRGSGWCEGDLGDPAALDAALAGADAVVHFAGLLNVGESVSQPAQVLAGQRGQKGVALLEAMAAGDVSRIIFSSTCATYGMPADACPSTRTHPQEPINPYGQSKRAFERALRDLRAARAGCARWPCATSTPRAAIPTAPWARTTTPKIHLIPLAIDAALGRRPALTVFGDDYDTPDGTCIRDYIHVQDLARAHVAGARGPGRRRAPTASTTSAPRPGTRCARSSPPWSGWPGRKVPARRRPATAGRSPRASWPPRRRSAASSASGPGTRASTTIVETALRWRRDHPQGYGAAA